MQPLDVLNDRITHCMRCPRLVAHREQVARAKRRQYRDWTYWGRPIPGFGDAQAALLVVGLAPAAHGGNRTGRVFTGDRSGDWLYEALHHYGFANQPRSENRDDGLKLKNCYIAAAVRCAPPDNKPTPDEFDTCREYLSEELRLLKRLRVVIALGKIAFDAYLRLVTTAGSTMKPRPVFRHGARYRLPNGLTLIGCYHPSRQNTNTGKLTARMMDQVMRIVQSELA